MEENKPQQSEMQQIAVSQKKTRNALMLVAGIVILLAYLGITVALFTLPIPQGNGQATSILTGAIMTNAGIIVGYYFGSSKSSSDKNEIIKQKLDENKN
jgi:flagellar basal body-associated protein FliL